MKKLIAVSIILVLFSGMAFAQLSEGLKLGAWGRAAVVPLEVRMMKDPADGHDKDTDLSAAQGQTWGGAFGRVRMDLSGANEFIGFNMMIQSDGGTPGFGDNAGIWVQPFSFLRLDLGLFKYDRLRGKIGMDTDYHQFVLADSGPDAIFQRFAGGTAAGAKSTGGALLSIIPVEALYIGAMVPNFPGINGWDQQYGVTEDLYVYRETFDHDNDPQTDDITIAIPTDTQLGTYSDTPARYIYENVQIAAGYNIDGIGLVRAQYVGGPDAPGTAKRIEFAFALTAVENLLVDIGAKIYMPFTQWKDNKAFPAQEYTKTNINQAHQINLGASYTLNDFGIMAKVNTSFGAMDGREKYVAPFTVNAHLLPSYNLGFATVGLELGMNAASESKLDTTEHNNDRFDFGAGVWVMKNLGKGYVKAGVTISTIDPVDDDAKNVTNGFFRIPIVAQFAF